MFHSRLHVKTSTLEISHNGKISWLVIGDLNIEFAFCYGNSISVII